MPGRDDRPSYDGGRRGGDRDDDRSGRSYRGRGGRGGGSGAPGRWRDDRSRSRSPGGGGRRDGELPYFEWESRASIMGLMTRMFLQTTEMNGHFFSFLVSELSSERRQRTPRRP